MRGATPHPCAGSPGRYPLPTQGPDRLLFSLPGQWHDRTITTEAPCGQSFVSRAETARIPHMAEGGGGSPPSPPFHQRGGTLPPCVRAGGGYPPPLIVQGSLYLGSFGQLFTSVILAFLQNRVIRSFKRVERGYIVQQPKKQRRDYDANASPVLLKKII